MKKKIISTLLAVTLTAAALAGCGNSSGGVESEPAAMVAEEYGITVVNLRMKISRARQWLYKNYHQSYLEL